MPEGLLATQQADGQPAPAYGRQGAVVSVAPPVWRTRRRLGAPVPRCSGPFGTSGYQVTVDCRRLLLAAGVDRAYQRERHGVQAGAAPRGPGGTAAPPKR